MQFIIKQLISCKKHGMASEHQLKKHKQNFTVVLKNALAIQFIMYKVFVNQVT